MRRMRARWVLGAPLVLGALALSCGGGGVDGLFTQPSSNGGGGGGVSSAGAANHAGAAHANGGSGGSNETSGGADPGSEAGASHGGATGRAGAAGSTASGAGGGGAGGTPAAGAGGSHAGAGGSHAGGGGAPAAGAGGAPVAGAGGAPAAGAGGAPAAGAGGGGGATCVDNGACTTQEYCAKTSCLPKAEGHCAPTPTDCGNTKLALVCGCDGVTYRDACLLHQARQNSSALDSGACSKAEANTVTCTESDAQKCTGLGGVCGFKAENACIAAGPGNTGICWVLPPSCPGSDDKTAQVCAVGSASCTSECEAIKNGQRYALPAQCN